MNVLFMMPPPMPISVEKKPITTPMIARAGLPGISVPSRQLSRLNSSRSAMTSAMMAKTARNSSLDR